MATIDRAPYKRSYMTRIFPSETDGGCRVEFFRHTMAVIDGKDYISAGDIVRSTLNEHGALTFPISETEVITPVEMWAFLVKWAATKNILPINCVAIHCPRGLDYRVDVTFQDPENPEGAVSESWRFDDIIGESVVLDSGRMLTIADCAAGIIGLGESLDSGV